MNAEEKLRRINRWIDLKIKEEEIFNSFPTSQDAPTKSNSDGYMQCLHDIRGFIQHEIETFNFPEIEKK